MLDLIMKTDVKTWITARSLKEANEAMVDMGAYVLVNENHAKQGGSNRSTFASHVHTQ